MSATFRNALLLLSSALAGCASYYVAPAQAPTAVLSFVTDMRPVMVLRFEDEQCGRSKDGMRLAYIDPVFTSKYGGPVKVEADKDLIFTVKKTTLATGLVPGWECTITSTFLPKAGEEYQVEFLNAPKGCVQRILRATKKDGEVIYVPEDSARRLSNICYTEFN